MYALFIESNFKGNLFLQKKEYKFVFFLSPAGNGNDSPESSGENSPPQLPSTTNRSPPSVDQTSNGDGEDGDDPSHRRQGSGSNKPSPNIEASQTEPKRASGVSAEDASVKPPDSSADVVRADVPAEILAIRDSSSVREKYSVKRKPVQSKSSWDITERYVPHEWYIQLC